MNKEEALMKIKECESKLDSLKKFVEDNDNKPWWKTEGEVEYLDYSGKWREDNRSCDNISFEELKVGNISDIGIVNTGEEDIIIRRVVK